MPEGRRLLLCPWGGAAPKSWAFSGAQEDLRESPNFERTSVCPAGTPKPTVTKHERDAILCGARSRVFTLALGFMACGKMFYPRGLARPSSIVAAATSRTAATHIQ